MSLRFTLSALLLAALVPVVAVPAQARDVTGLQTLTLANGMEVFLVENHSVPLARIQITFRTGAMSQAPGTAGLFHLYEHMLFKGNAAHPTQSDLQASMKDLGVSDWNGGTSGENVTYYFTVPTDRVERGIQFWADAARSPLLDPGELSTEKDVVVNEILGYLSDPGNIFASAIDKALFWKYPWRKDESGSEALIRSATVQALRGIRDTWYVPNNAALFVGGDIDPAAVRAAVQKSFGDWPRARDPWVPPPPPQEAPRNDIFLVYPDEQMYAGVASVGLAFRGPDVTRDPAATHAADVWGSLLDDPNGRFKSRIFSEVPGLYRKEYMSASYRTLRDGGYISFSTLMVADPAKDTFQRLVSLKKAFVAEMASIASTPGYFSQRDFAVLVRQIADQRVFERETVDGFISELSDLWSTAGTAYYLGYDDALRRVGPKDIASFLSAYVLHATSVLSVRMSPGDFAREKDSAVKQGWTLVTKDNAYWWADKGGAQ
jgi:zinc protease